MVKKIIKAYFSPTGTTRVAVSSLAGALTTEFSASQEEIDFTLPAERWKTHKISSEDLLIIGSPTYAGKLPNRILPYFKEGFTCESPDGINGNGSNIINAVALVTYGHRSFDNSLAELVQSLQDSGFNVIAACAIPTRHPFSETLGAGRPDDDDLRQIEYFGRQIAKKIKKQIANNAPPLALDVPGDADAPYYTPLGQDLQPAVFLKAKPKTNIDLCVHCGLCARRCPMGAISPDDVTQVPGTCIKCHACVRLCPKEAKYFDDSAFLSHKAMLEEHYSDTNPDPELFL